jgi:predicted Ser/Thr protein kinase
MDSVNRALNHLKHNVREGDHTPLAFEDFLHQLVKHPRRHIRNVFQLFHDMVKHYVREEVDEYPDDPESIHYLSYDCAPLFVADVDHPFFADRLFANRLINLAEAFKSGAQQNKIYIFEGPHGCGKSTFLNNLLHKFERFVNTADGTLYETVWRLDRRVLGSFSENQKDRFLDRLSSLLDTYEFGEAELAEARSALSGREDYLEIPCPGHDHPLLQIPKEHRRRFLDDLLPPSDQKSALLFEKEYEWLFRDLPCTICTSLYEALLGRMKNSMDVLSMVYARPYRFNRRLGEGISVFNPGDRPMKQTILGNEMLQGRLNGLLRDSNLVRYTFSRYAKTNNGVYALMDVKTHNVERLIELHNIISEGVHKVEDLEENVSSLFLALMNPEDKANIRDVPSFSDRIEYIHIPYVLDLRTEVEIYRHVFGETIDQSFLPRVLHNFARVIIATRLDPHSPALLEWIGSPDKYRHYCDENLLLLKMEIYTGHIPPWLEEDDRKRLTAKRRRQIIGESEQEGIRGFSGRDSIKIFNEFHSSFARKDKLISMSMLRNYFTRIRQDLGEAVPGGFLDSLVRMYDYMVLQEVKESLYYYNEERISRDIQNYLFAINFEIGATGTCEFTGEKLTVTEEFLHGIEERLLGDETDGERRLAFRRDTQREYTSTTLTQEVLLEGHPLTHTHLYQTLYEMYVRHLKEKALDPFLENENFRRAIKDYGAEDFRTYDKKIRDDVGYLIGNLCSRYRYTPNGAKEVCIYVVDNRIAERFAHD